MNAAQRRERILTRLNSAGAPLSASTLAAELGVSRQIVVGDVALLRAGGAQIDATPGAISCTRRKRAIPAFWPVCTARRRRCAGSCTLWWIRAAQW